MVVAIQMQRVSATPFVQERAVSSVHQVIGASFVTGGAISQAAATMDAAISKVVVSATMDGRALPATSVRRGGTGVAVNIRAMRKQAAKDMEPVPATGPANAMLASAAKTVRSVCLACLAANAPLPVMQ